MTRLALILSLLSSLVFLAGCARGGEGSLDAFREKWYASVNQRQPEQLYHLLDAKGRRFIDVQLETLRGLDAEKQKSVINWLGGDRVSNLHELNSARFFGLMWRKVTDDQPPKMVIEAQGDQGAYMVLNLREKSQRIELKIEGGRWVWALPEQRFTLEVKKGN